MSEATNVVQHPSAAPARGGSIYQAIPRVMEEVGAVEKSRRNEQQKYQFRGIDDVYAALQLVLAKHGVFVVPRVLEAEWDSWETKNGGRMIGVRTKIEHTLYASDGSSVHAVTLGEAMDTGDKASNKAMSVAMKYALIEVFCIPTSDPKDPENDSPEAPPPKRQAPANQQGKAASPSAAPATAQSAGAAATGSSTGSKPPQASHQQAKDINFHLGKMNLTRAYEGMEETAARLWWCSQMVGRKVERMSQLTAEEADRLINAARAGEMPQS